MSTHTFTHGALKVQAGWDRPLQYFYLVIERLQRQQGEPTLVYCNLDDPQARFDGGLTLDQVQARLEEHHLPVPAGLLDALREDQRVNRGNHDVTWTVDAPVTTQA
ncbi:MULTISPECIES: hypothetical protein [Deinococcus]|uniref:Uncharacterized protein n=1 Tax=Deinococcus daejeonensis TaxID=1007098 RepID=A0ABQ2JJP3_9DEIO|nr:MULTISPECIES: hypothetical protein [Deinococcus]GGN46547.1 hypothetical protein GCM10010842_37190 [Deinococcus daejeonensis]